MPFAQDTRAESINEPCKRWEGLSPSLGEGVMCIRHCHFLVRKAKYLRFMTCLTFAFLSSLQPFLSWVSFSNKTTAEAELKVLQKCQPGVGRLGLLAECGVVF